MTSSLDALMSNLVGVSEMVCGNCRGSCELTHIDEDYIDHRKCRNCYSGYSKRQLNVDSTYRAFDDLRANHTDEQFRLLQKKGVYPYEYMTSCDKFSEMRLPPKKDFYSNLIMGDISNHDCSHFQKVWKGFDMKNLGEYHDLYLKTDVLLLSNVF